MIPAPQCKLHQTVFLLQMFTYNMLVSFPCSMIMPYYPAEEEDPNQSEWQLIISFCCKGMIEGVILLLLLWLLIQVLFVSNLEGKLLDMLFSLNSHTVEHLPENMCVAGSWARLRHCLWKCQQYYLLQVKETTYINHASNPQTS